VYQLRVPFALIYIHYKGFRYFRRVLKTKMIAVSENNWIILRNMGHCGDSFNDVLTELLKKITVADLGSSPDQQSVIDINANHLESDLRVP
jgi:hypothetical protein